MMRFFCLEDYRFKGLKSNISPYHLDLQMQDHHCEHSILIDDFHPETQPKDRRDTKGAQCYTVINSKYSYVCFWQLYLLRQQSGKFVKMVALTLCQAKP